jgi:3(or 17)beta-hydroxysteroid dehydrogenase
MGRVEGKVALVTGGGSGLGRADVIAMAGEGAKVVVTDIDAEGAAETIRLAGGDCTFMHHDVANEDEWKDVIAKTLETYGKLNILVNNAGMLIPGNVEDIDTAIWRKHQQVHMDGCFYGIKYGIEAMKQNDEMCSIINVSSTTALIGYGDVFAYMACKGAIRSMSKGAAITCQDKGYNIRVNSIHPGVITTPLITNMQAGAPPLPEGVEPPAPPIWGLGEPSDVGYMVLYLASDESKFVNGTEMVIDNASVIRP